MLWRSSDHRVRAERRERAAVLSSYWLSALPLAGAEARRAAGLDAGITSGSGSASGPFFSGTPQTPRGEPQSLPGPLRPHFSSPLSPLPVTYRDCGRGGLGVIEDPQWGIRRSMGIWGGFIGPPHRPQTLRGTPLGGELSVLGGRHALCPHLGVPLPPHSDPPPQLKTLIED